jgi:hypothetical protein
MRGSKVNKKTTKSRERKMIMFTNVAMMIMVSMVGVSAICGCTSLMHQK